MKRTVTVLICLFLLTVGALLVFSQEKTDPEEKVSQTPKKSVPSYNPAGRRDPFRDLLGGRDVQPPVYAEGVPQIYIEDVVLIGIVKSRDQCTAIITDGQGFPYYIKEGAELADGFVRLVEESRIIFRKTHERGAPLVRPRDIIKELQP